MASSWTRRDLLRMAVALPAGAWLARYEAMAAPLRNKVKITAVKAMALRDIAGNCLIRIDTDAGLTGYGEAGSTGPMARARIETMRTQLSGKTFAPRIFGNCLEAIPFLLKRRRYDADFLKPDSAVARRLIRFLEEVDREYRWRLPTRLQQFPKATLNFLRMNATLTDLEQLLGVDDEDDDD